LSAEEPPLPEAQHVCRYCGFVIEDPGQDCAALDDGRCLLVSLDGPTASLMGARRRAAVSIADVDALEDGARCPRCHTPVAAVGTPTIPVEFLAGDELGLAPQERGGERVPVFGWRCDRHRVRVVLPAPAELAPDSYRSVDVNLAEDEATVGVPAPLLEVVR